MSSFSTDVLEHIPPAIRPNVVRETVRVGRRLLYFVCRVGPAAQIYEQKLDQVYQKFHGYQHRFIEELLRLELPSTGSILSAIDLAARLEGRPVTVKARSVLNLRVWYLLMNIWIRERQLFFYYLYKLLNLLLPLRQLLDFGHCYRHLFFVYLDHPDTGVLPEKQNA